MGFVGGGAGDLNHDGVPDLVIGAVWATPSSDRSGPARSFVFYGGRAHLAALDLADGTQDGRIEHCRHSTARTASSINGSAAGDESRRSIGAGDVNGDHIDDLIVGATAGSAGSIGQDYVVFGRDSTAGQVFPGDPRALVAERSNGFVIPGLGSSRTMSFGDPGGRATSTATGSTTSSSGILSRRRPAGPTPARPT